MITSLTSDTLQVLALFAVGDVYVSRCKKVLTLHLARGEGRERYFGCNLMQRKVLASSHQHLMAEAPKVSSGNIVRHGFYRTRSGKRRRYRCGECGKTFSSTKGTPYYRLQH